MSNLEVRVRTVDMTPSEALVVGEIPFRAELIPKAQETLRDIGGNLFDVDISHDQIRWFYQIEEDGTRVFLAIVMDISNV